MCGNSVPAATPGGGAGSAASKRTGADSRASSSPSPTSGRAESANRSLATASTVASSGEACTNGAARPGAAAGSRVIGAGYVGAVSGRLPARQRQQMPDHARTLPKRTGLQRYRVPGGRVARSGGEVVADAVRGQRDQRDRRRAPDPAVVEFAPDDQRPRIIRGQPGAVQQRQPAVPGVFDAGPGLGLGQRDRGQPGLVPADALDLVLTGVGPQLAGQA